MCLIQYSVSEFIPVRSSTDERYLQALIIAKL